MKQKTKNNAGEDEPPNPTEVPSNAVREMEGTSPVTDTKSKNVMISAERRDGIEIVDVVEKFESGVTIPEDLSVIRRVSRYYGPELILYAEQETGQNYLLTAPGRENYLLLWKAITDDLARRKTYSKIAEVKASLSAGSGYDLCPDCGQPFQTVEHERLSAIGQCPNI
jgi:hypothetical protein